MTTSATQDTGVQSDQTKADAAGNPATTDDKTPEPTARELAMEAIASTRQEGFEAEMAGAPAATPAPTPAPVVDDQLAAQLEDSRTVLTDNLDKVFFKSKVDGVESEVPVAEAVRQYQKNSAADRRLDEASRLLREAREQTEANKAGTRPPVGNDGTGKPADIQPQPAEDAKASRRKLLSALFEGDEEKALSALDEVIPGRQQPTPDMTELTAQLTPAIKQQLVVESALEQFQKDYADIVKDPYLATIADQFIEAEVKDGKSLDKAIAEGGKKTRDWLVSKGMKTATEPTPTMDRNTKLERKAGIDVIPALNTKATIVDEPEQGPSDVIAEMRKARGMTV